MQIEKFKSMGLGAQEIADYFVRGGEVSGAARGVGGTPAGAFFAGCGGAAAAGGESQRYVGAADITPTP